MNVSSVIIPTIVDAVHADPSHRSEGGQHHVEQLLPLLLVFPTLLLENISINADPLGLVCTPANVAQTDR